MREFAVILSILFSFNLSAQNESLELAKKLVNTDPEKSIALASDFFESGGYLAAKANAISAQAREKMGHYIKAYGQYTLALEELFLSDTLDHYLEYACYNNMAIIASETNQYEISADLYGKAAAAAERYVEFQPETAKYYGEEFLSNKARFYQGNALYDAGLIAEAAEIYKSLDEGLENDEVEDLNTFALLRNEYGLNAKAIKDFANAEFYFNTVLNMAGVHGYYKQSASHNLALVYLEQDSLQQALDQFDAALQIKGATDMQYFITRMDKGELLMDLGKNAKAVQELKAAVAMNVDFSHDLRLMNVYYLLERASKSLNIEESNLFGEQYQALVEQHIARQGELIAQEKKRVFAMAISEAYQQKKIEQMQSAKFWGMVTSAVLVLLAVLLTALGVTLLVKLKIRRTIMQ